MSARLDWQGGQREEDRIKQQDQQYQAIQQRRRHHEAPPAKPQHTFYHKITPADIATGEIAPFVVHEKVPCDLCADAVDFEEVNPNKPCTACHGRKFLTVKRRWLAEAFELVANPASSQRIERGHLIALASYSRVTVAALMPRFPE